MYTDTAPYPIGLAAVPSHFAQQLAASTRLAPAEAYRGHTVLLITCRGDREFRRAEEALTNRWDFDAVQHLPLPVRSWSEVCGDGKGNDPWLRACILRASDRHDPSLVAILDDSDSLGSSSEDPAAELPQVLHRWGTAWGTALPVAVLRIRPDSEVEWIAPPALTFRNCG